jgi:hypothetical protein
MHYHIEVFASMAVYNKTHYKLIFFFNSKFIKNEQKHWKVMKHGSFLFENRYRVRNADAKRYLHTLNIFEK